MFKKNLFSGARPIPNQQYIHQNNFYRYCAGVFIVYYEQLLAHWFETILFGRKLVQSNGKTIGRYRRYCSCVFFKLQTSFFFMIMLCKLSYNIVPDEGTFVSFIWTSERYIDEEIVHLIGSNFVSWCVCTISFLCCRSP